MFSLILYISLSGQIIATPAGNFDTMAQCSLKGQAEQKARKDVVKFTCFDARRVTPTPPPAPVKGEGK